jgi:NAD(P)-dependent dehydrogenase (short-subunit alcohol dehydrogenase family)
MVKAVERELGTIEILVNNAGIARRYPWDQVPEEGWDEIMNINLKSAFLVTQAILPGMRARKVERPSIFRQAVPPAEWYLIMPPAKPAFWD